MRRPGPAARVHRVHRSRRSRRHRALVAGFSTVMVTTTLATLRPVPPVRTMVWVNGRAVALASRATPDQAAADRSTTQPEQIVAGLGPATAGGLRAPNAMAGLRSPETVAVRPSVGTAVSAARLPVHAGDVLSVTTRRVIGHTPLQIAVNGGPALLWSPVRAGDRISVASGPDVTERVVARPAAGSAGGLPDVERQLWHPPETASPVLVGEVSGEVVDTGRPATSGTPARPETAKVVALTFDDGPDPKWTPQVLAILRDEGVPGTFCLVGRSAARNAAIAAAEVAQGHTICNHTADHDVKLNTAPHERVVSQITDGETMVRAASGVTPLFYRPPAGALSPDVIAVAHQNSLRVLYWTIDPSDYLKPAANVLVERIMSKMVPGAVILLHDGGGDRSQTVAALKPLIERLKSDGYRFTTPAMETAAT